MVFLELIEKKKVGAPLAADEIEWSVEAYLREEIPDYQMAAFLMAVRWRGLTDEETAVLTRSMARSGETFDFSAVDGPKVDKHSTGGVGDKVSLALAPLAAACGCVVPMVSGRGLGHTGGTLDKLESIPGFRTDLDAAAFHAQLETIGVAMGAQTAELVPADRRLYELRSLTGTVDDTGLITASILSKKIAEGADSLVLDVKVGSGAFMREPDDARALAERLCHVAGLAGLRCAALITDMSQPLGAAVGNAIEVAEAIDLLNGDAEAPPDLRRLTVELTAEMILLGGLAEADDALRTAQAALDDGSARERFAQLVETQGGDPRIVENPGLLPQPAASQQLLAPATGYVGSLDARLVGDAALSLGAGRVRREDPVDPAAGLRLHVKYGSEVDRDAPWATLYYGDQADVARAVAKLEEAISIVPEQPPEVPLVKERYP